MISSCTAVTIDVELNYKLDITLSKKKNEIAHYFITYIYHHKSYRIYNVHVSNLRTIWPPYTVACCNDVDFNILAYLFGLNVRFKEKTNIFLIR